MNKKTKGNLEIAAAPSSLSGADSGAFETARTCRRDGALRLIFLDIDGVICTPESYAQFSGSHAPPVQRCLDALNYLCAKSGAFLVISSTWRFEGRMFMREWLAKWGVRVPVVGITEWPPLDEGRGVEIERWLEGYPRDVESFVILDDDDDMGSLSRRHVHVDGAWGLTMADAAKAINILEGRA
jgi:hypothetical protein